MNAHAAKPDLGADGPAARNRLSVDTKIVGTKRIAARTVASDPLDHYSMAGQITDDQHEAGMRLRAAISGSWPAGRITAKALYASQPGDHDELAEHDSEEEQWAEMTRCYNEKRDAERIVGAQFWPTVQGVCSGEWATQRGGLRVLQLGLQALVVGWRIGGRA